jgi:hypothetical protein
VPPLLLPWKYLILYKKCIRHFLSKQYFLPPEFVNFHLTQDRRPMAQQKAPRGFFCCFLRIEKMQALW